MRIGLYLDLAVGVSPDGATSWSEGRAVARAARIGCPPDPFSTEGQDWGLVPFSPLGLEAERYEPFRALLRANMHHAGALRLDHAMGLQRLYWIPEGESARDGAYVRYPFRALLEAVAEESCVFGTIVIGEDLGTVPPGFTDTIVRAGLLSLSGALFRAQPTRLPAARGLSPRGARLRLDPRPADAERLVDGNRYRLARADRARDESRGGSPQAGPLGASGQSSSTPWPRRDCCRPQAPRTRRPRRPCPTPPSSPRIVSSPAPPLASSPCSSTTRWGRWSRPICPAPWTSIPIGAARWRSASRSCAITRCSAP